MRSIVQAVILLLLMSLMSGCGGGGQRQTEDSQLAVGEIALAVEWPEPDGRAIPVDTAKIVVEILKSGLVVKTGEIVRPASTLSMSRVPAGKATVRGKAYDSAGVLLSSGETSADIKPNASTAVTLTLGVVAPPVDSDSYVVSGSVAPDPDNPSTVLITLSALLDRNSGHAVSDLTDANFEVYEDDIRRLPLQVNAMNSTFSKADIAFAVDATGSMYEEIAGVRDSIDAFVTHLVDSGVDVRLGGVAFWDHVGDVQPLATNMDLFRDWVSSLYASEGGDGPEVSVDAVMTLRQTLDWRPDAQRIIIVITDASSHQRGDGTEYALYTAEDVNSACLGNTVVYAISPGEYRSSRSPSNDGSASSSRSITGDVDVKVLADGTGGLWLELPYSGSIDLRTLPIGSTILQGYLVRFSSTRTNSDHRIRLVVTISGEHVADQFFDARY